MKRTVALNLTLSEEQVEDLFPTQTAFAEGCNVISGYAQENRCWNPVALHHLCYYKVRTQLPHLGSQMVCNAIRKVCASYKALRIKKNQEVPKIVFNSTLYNLRQPNFEEAALRLELILKEGLNNPF